jgi:hypothetical protein
MEELMAKVTGKTANWRLYGGTAILVAGLLSLLAHYLHLGPLQAIAWVILAAGLIILAFGQTGGNGAVGKYVIGKVALVLYAAGWVLLALNVIPVELPAFALTIAALLIIVGGLVSAWAIERQAIAKGAAQWILFLPAVVGALVVVGYIAPALATLEWMLDVLALLFAIAGALYLLNDRKLG